MLAAALDGKSDMVGHGKGKVCRELTRDVGTGDIRDLSGELHHLRVDLVEQRQVARVDTVEGSVNLVERDLVGATGKPDTAAERNELAPFCIDADNRIIVDPLEDFHDAPYPAQAPAPRARLFHGNSNPVNLPSDNRTILPVSPSSFDKLEEKLRGFGELVMLRASPSSVHTRWVPLGLNNLL